MDKQNEEKRINRSNAGWMDGRREEGMKEKKRGRKGNDG